MVRRGRACQPGLSRGISMRSAPIIVHRSHSNRPSHLCTEVDTEGWLVRHLAHKLRMPPDALERQQPLVRYGLDSLVALELVAELEDWLGCTLPLTLAWEYPTIAALASHLQEVMQSSGPYTPREVPEPGIIRQQPLLSLDNAVDMCHQPDH